MALMLVVARAISRPGSTHCAAAGGVVLPEPRRGHPGHRHRRLRDQPAQAEWRGLGNSIQVVGYKLGMVAGSGLLCAGHPLSVAGELRRLACLMLVVLLPVLFMDQARRPRSRRQRTRPGTGCAAT